MTLTAQLERYLELRRRFGYALKTEEGLLRRFTDYADKTGADYVSVELFLAWKGQFGSANAQTWSRRLSMVRGFARWMQSIDARTEVPPAGLLPAKTSRSRPYIYSDAEIHSILQEATHISSWYGLQTYAILFGLLAVSGMRVSEAIKLHDDDVDPEAGVLTIRHAKNRNARVVPLSRSTAETLATYRTERRRFLGKNAPAFFLQESSRPTTDCAVRYAFAHVCQRVGLRAPQSLFRHGVGPRIHDLRHTFAVNTLIRWYQADLNIDAEMPKLSAWLGHTKPSYTYWYIEAVPELMRLAAERIRT